MRFPQLENMRLMDAIHCILWFFRLLWHRWDMELLRAAVLWEVSTSQVVFVVFVMQHFLSAKSLLNQCIQEEHTFHINWRSVFRGYVSSSNCSCWEIHRQWLFCCSLHSQDNQWLCFPSVQQFEVYCNHRFSYFHTSARIQWLRAIAFNNASKHNPIHEWICIYGLR